MNSENQPLSIYPPQSINQRLLDWGRNSNFAPALEPNNESSTELRHLQEDLLPYFIGGEAIRQLHATLFFCHPGALVNFIKQHCEPNIDTDGEVTLYMDLINTLSTALFMSAGSMDIETDGIEAFGDRRNIVALKLARTAALSVWRTQTRSLLIRNLREFHGLSDRDTGLMRKNPELRWLIEDSEAHISLVSSSLPIYNIPSGISTPSVITIDKIRPGKPDFPIELLQMFPDSLLQDLD